ncbi:MAG: 50S ribosomal protein L11 methyltransferase [Gammaproteobacteria bacterium]
MPWLELKVDCTPEEVERLSDALSEAGAAAVTWQDAADQPLFEPPPGETPLWTRTRVVALFEDDGDIEAAVADVGRILGEPLRDWRVDPLEDRDWTRAWMDGFQPMRFGERLWICPSWHNPPEPEAVNILLDPGLAFGTGTHPTTALCLEWLDAQARAGTLNGASVLDYGCGSGVLAIAAALLGAEQVFAVDNDPQALLATRANAAANGVESRIEVAAPEALPARQFDVLVANILAGPLIELAARFAGLARPGAPFALSGILDSQAEAVSAAYAPWFELDPPAARGEWIRLEGHRK